MFLSSGAFWTLSAEIIMDIGGLKNFGVNWGVSILANFLGSFVFQLFQQFFDYDESMGWIYLIAGIITPVLIFVSYLIDAKDKFKDRKVRER